MIEIIPAIDIIDGKCVRLSQGDFTKRTTYAAAPVDIAKDMEAAGIRRIHLVDLDGAKTGKVINLATLKEVAQHTNLIIDFGGGIKTFEDATAVFEAGAAMINIGSMAAKQPDTIIEWSRLVGAEKMLIGADVIDCKIAVNGWQQITGLDVFDFIDVFYKEGINQFFCTDIKKDGMLQGPSVELYKEILQKFPAISLTASGGITTMEDIKMLEEIGCTGVIVGKAWHEGLISVSTINRN